MRPTGGYAREVWEGAVLGGRFEPGGSVDWRRSLTTVQISFAREKILPEGRSESENTGAQYEPQQSAPVEAVPPLCLLGSETVNFAARTFIKVSEGSVTFDDFA